MAAQKLTKGRLAQIILMLTILVVAFIWRTINFSNPEAISCFLQPNCSFTIDKARFSAVKNDKGVSLSLPSSDWSIEGKERGLAIRIDKLNAQISNDNEDFEVKLKKKRFLELQLVKALQSF